MSLIDKWTRRFSAKATEQTGTAQLENVLTQSAQSAAIIFRIDNGYILSMERNDGNSYGVPARLVFVKDAEGIAEQIIANEATFKLRNTGSALTQFIPPNSLQPII